MPASGDSQSADQRDEGTLACEKEENACVLIFDHVVLDYLQAITMEFGD
jgi:hypothetical protein